MKCVLEAGVLARWPKRKAQIIPSYHRVDGNRQSLLGRNAMNPPAFSNLPGESDSGGCHT
jgi:hypothetical protein